MSSHKISYGKWDAAISETGLKHRRTCILFTKQQQLQQVSPQQQNDECGCGRLKTSHSYAGLPRPQRNDNWNYATCSELIEDKKNFGILYNSYEACLTKLIRCDMKVSVDELYKLIQNDCKHEPNLIISIFGGAKYFKMNERLEKEFLRGIVEAAATAGNV
ncbi:unnamed protein product [Rotaria sordida]|uniref:TRPM SLOG domain-containing protein n=1 Tax=Rotaria sordida TaxID=392033 RepID=A0A818U5D5_9BILA|nr:unnamed protein product [Rotaria sordida]CAF1547116.1 unnamed protein product [Rotaria sordida]CAF3693135.1 unnamed protein product [Rotaria sordida]CAF4163889.1 unnamed protein product [Rotaria sordida]